MTPETYKEQGKLPKAGDVIWSPHEFIRKRGYPFTYKVLRAQRKKRDGEYNLLLTVKKTTPTKKVVGESMKVWFDEID